MGEAKETGAPTFSFTFLFPWACGCRADSKWRHQESLMWSDFPCQPPPAPQHSHVHTQAHACL